MVPHADSMTTPFDRVRSLISACGLTQARFAQEVGLDPTKLSKSLSGTRRFTSMEFAAIAARCDVSVDWILTGEEPALATAARGAIGSTVEQALAEATRLIELRESATRIGYQQRWRPVAYASGSGLAIERGAALAAAALDRLESLDLDVVALDLAGVIEQAFGVDVCLAPLGQSFDGLAAATPEAKLIVAAVSPVPYRQRFTIAHELGHLLASDDQGIHRDPDIMASHTSRDISEMQANAFAAGFLMPEAVLSMSVKPGFTETRFAELSARLLVSPSALAYRLEGLRLIDGMTRDRWRGMTAKRAASLAGAECSLSEAAAYSSTPRVPRPLAHDLFTAYLKGATTLRPYANLLGVDASVLREGIEDPDSDS